MKLVSHPFPGSGSVDCCLVNAACSVIKINRLTAPGGGGYSHTLPIRVCAAQRGRDFEAPDLERGINFRGVF